MIKILVATNLSESYVESIRQISPQIEIKAVIPGQAGTSSTQWFEALSSAQVILGSYSEMGFDLALAPQLRWIHLTSAGVDKILSKPIWTSSISITTSSGLYNVAIGQYVLASMLAFSHHFPELYTWQQRRRWPQVSETRNGIVSRELRGATLGVLGYGSIGREVARLGQGFGMRVVALKNNPATREDPGWSPPGIGDPAGAIPESIFGPDQLHGFLSQCDYLAITMPLTPKTEKMIDEAALRVMRPNAYVVNIGRGKIIDEPALIRALKEGWIGGAGLDVTTVEPLPSESELYDLPNVILTPHFSGGSNRSRERLVQVFSENLRRYIAGETLLNLADRERKY